MDTKCRTAPELAGTPMFITEAEAFARDMTRYDDDTLVTMFKCSKHIAVQNRLRYQRFFDSDNPSAPAILAYRGQAYRHLMADTLTADDIAYADGHLWITSFLYGLLRPTDGIHAYRLEGSLRLPAAEGLSLFDFWRPRLTELLIRSVKQDDGILVHLATEEFQHMFDWQRVRREVRVVQPLFYIRKNGELKIRAVWAKTCRGAMTRFLITNRISRPEDMNIFSYEGFEHCPQLGEPDFPHFVLS